MPATVMASALSPASSEFRIADVAIRRRDEVGSETDPPERYCKINGLGVHRRCKVADAKQLAQVEARVHREST